MHKPTSSPHPFPDPLCTLYSVLSTLYSIQYSIQHSILPSLLPTGQLASYLFHYSTASFIRLPAATRTMQPMTA